MLPDNSTALEWTARDVTVGVYSTVCLLLGFFGNVFVLVTSLVYKSIDLVSLLLQSYNHMFKHV